jgi:hypothetical protein
MNGVCVNEYMCTGSEDIFAAGDIAIFPYAYPAHPSLSNLRIEHWDVAIDQGRIAGRNMVGGASKKKYECVPFFWTKQLNMSLRSAGYCFNIEDMVIHGDLDSATAPENAKAVVYFVQGGNVASVMTVNLNDSAAVAAMELIRLRALPTVKELQDLAKQNKILSLADRLNQVVASAAAADAAPAAAGTGTNASSSASVSPAPENNGDTVVNRGSARRSSGSRTKAVKAST